MAETVSHRRISGTANGVSFYHASLYSGKSPVADHRYYRIYPCYDSETLHAAMAYKPPHLTYYDSVEPSRYVISGKLMITHATHAL